MLFFFFYCSDLIASHCILFQPKLLPLKSVTLERLERMQTEANEKAKEMQRDLDIEKDQLQVTHLQVFII